MNMTCKDCIHYDVCAKKGRHFAKEYGKGHHAASYVEGVEWKCKCFIEKSRFIELPCKVGDTVYQVDSERIYESTVEKIIYDTDGIAFDETAIGESVFLTKEEAEKALERRKENV